jgi:HTH-type transcriptional regulator/antitoxin HigA
MTRSMPILSEPILVRPIKTEADYDAVLVEVEQMMGIVAPGTPEGDRFDLLVTLVNTYEDAHFPLETTADPISMIEFVMEQQGLTRRDLQPFIGPRQRVWDVMERRRPLSLSMIRRLEQGLHIPAGLLVQEYELRTARPGRTARTAEVVA